MPLDREPELCRLSLFPRAATGGRQKRGDVFPDGSQRFGQRPVAASVFLKLLLDREPPLLHDEQPILEGAGFPEISSSFTVVWGLVGPAVVPANRPPRDLVAEETLFRPFVARPT